MPEDKELSLAQLARQCQADSEKWFGDVMGEEVHSIPFFALCLGGEAGEFQNEVKKVWRGSSEMNNPVTRVKLATELTDVLVYLLNLASLMNLDLYKSYQMVRGNNERRFMAERSTRENGQGNRN